MESQQSQYGVTPSIVDLYNWVETLARKINGKKHFAAHVLMLISHWQIGDKIEVSLPPITITVALHWTWDLQHEVVRMARTISNDEDNGLDAIL